MPINPTLPTDGQTPWGAPLRAALQTMIGAINDTEAVIESGRLSQSGIEGTVSSEVASALDDALPPAVDAATATLFDSDSAARRAVTSLTQDVFFGGPYTLSPLARLRQGIVNSSLSTRVVILGSSTFAGGAAAKPGAGVSERLAYRAGATELASLDAVTEAPAAGMHWFQGAVGGSTSSTYFPSSRLTKVQLVQPHYVLHAVGSNDWASQVPLATYEANMRAAIESIESAVPGVVNVLIHQQARYDVTRAIPWSAYGQVLEDLAAEKPAQRVAVNVDAILDSINMGSGNRWDIITADKIHMNDAGHRLLADILSTFLGIPSERLVGEQRYDMTFPASATYTSGATLTSRAFGAVSYPRVVTVKANVYTQANSGLGELIVTSDGSPVVATRITDVGDGRTRSVLIDVDVHVAPNTAPTIALLLSTTGSLYVSGSAAYTLGQFIVRPY